MSPENNAAPQNDFIGGLAPSTPATPVGNSLNQAQQQAPVVIEVPVPHTEIEPDTAVGEGLVTADIETVHYADGSSATGHAPLPRVSPNGSPAVDASGSAAQPSPYSDDTGSDSLGTALEAHSEPKPDYQALYAQEVLAHQQTTLALAAAQKIVANAKAMGFSGAGIHTGA